MKQALWQAKLRDSLRDLITASMVKRRLDPGGPNVITSPSLKSRVSPAGGRRGSRRSAMGGALHAEMPVWGWRGQVRSHADGSWEQGRAPLPANRETGSSDLQQPPPKWAWQPVLLQSLQVRACQRCHFSTEQKMWLKHKLIRIIKCVSKKAKQNNRERRNCWLPGDEIKFWRWNSHLRWNKIQIGLKS